MSKHVILQVALRVESFVAFGMSALESFMALMRGHVHLEALLFVERLAAVWVGALEGKMLQRVVVAEHVNPQPRSPSERLLAAWDSTVEGFLAPSWLLCHCLLAWGC